MRTGPGIGSGRSHCATTPYAFWTRWRFTWTPRERFVGSGLRKDQIDHTAKGTVATTAKTALVRTRVIRSWESSTMIAMMPASTSAMPEFRVAPARPLVQAAAASTTGDASRAYRSSSAIVTTRRNKKTASLSAYPNRRNTVGETTKTAVAAVVTSREPSLERSTTA